MALKKPPQPQGYELHGPDPAFPDVPYAEWKSRIDRAKQLMKENDIDLLMLWSNQNCRYFTAYRSIHWHVTSIQPMVALIPVEGDPVVVAGELFRWTIEGMCWVRDIRCQEDVHQVLSERDFPKDVAEVVRDMGYDKGKIALEKGPLGCMWIPRPLNDIETLIGALPKAQFVDGDKVIWGCRMIKSTLEIERLTRAAEIHRQASLAVADKFRPGMTEFDVGRIYVTSAYENGAEWCLSGHICCGPAREGMWDTGYVRGSTIHKGDYLSLDIPLSYEGYWADMGRMFNVGPATDAWKKCYSAILDGFDAGLAAMKPGATGKDVHKAVADVIGPGGIVPFEMYGHGIGLDIHEPPVLGCLDDEVVLEPGMAFELEPCGIGEGGLRKMGGVGAYLYENLVIITETGAYPVFGSPKEVIETAYY